jgi:hypothetical protein
MRKLFIRLFLALFFLVFLVGCAGRDPDYGVKHPTKFQCFQQGVKILDVKTLDGADIEFVGDGDYKTKAWVWDDLEGKQSLTISVDLSCMQSPIKKK